MQTTTRVRRAISRGASIAIVVVVIIIIVGGAYAALTLTSSSTTATSSSSSLSNTTSSSTISSASSGGSTISIGMIAPLSGANQAWGVLQVDGAQLAVNQINANGGVLGKQLKLVTQDEGATSATAVTAAQILVSQDGVSFIIGPGLSGDVSAVLPFTYQNKVIEMITSASSDAIMVPPTNQYLFRVGISDQGIAFYLSSWLKMIGAKGNVAYEAENYLYTSEIYNETQAYLASQTGITLLAPDYYPGTATDYSAAINKIAAEKPAAVIVVMSSTNSVDFQKQYAANPITAAIPVNSADGILDIPQNAQSVEAAVQGGMNNAFVSELTTLSNKTAQFNSQLQTSFGVGANSYSADPYAVVNVLVQAIKAAGTINTDAVQATLLNQQFCGPSGCIKFQSSHSSFYGVGYVTGTILQAIDTGGVTHYNIVWPPNVANATAINPSTGKPYA